MWQSSHDYRINVVVSTNFVKPCGGFYVTAGSMNVCSRHNSVSSWLQHNFNVMTRECFHRYHIVCLTTGP
jgi:hypothetical protein